MPNPPSEPELPAAAPLREVSYEHSREFVPLLRQLRVAVLVSTYQAGKLVCLGSGPAGLRLSFHHFDQAMGVAVHPRQIAVGGRNQVWFLRSAPDLPRQMEPAGQCDACYLARSSHFTDDIQVHEMAWVGDELWLVNTRFSCLCTLDDAFSFVPRWKPPFISQLAAEDRCHVNGLATDSGRPRYVTALSETDAGSGWRPVKSTAGCLIDLASGETVARGFAMPHSPRIYRGRVWLLNSGCGQLLTVDPAGASSQVVTQQPGYARGLAFCGPYAFIGLSKIRETSTFGGMPIAEHREGLKCAIAVVDLRTGRRVAHFEFTSGVEEIFDVQLLPGIHWPHLSGPQAAIDGTSSVWLAPAVRTIPSSLDSPGPSPRLTTSLPASTRVDAASGRDTAGSPQRDVPASALALYQRGNGLADADRFEEAAACYRDALAIAPQSAEAHCNLGVVLQFQRRLSESAACLQQAITLRPDFPAAHFNLAMTWFLAGDLQRAWPEYEWRWRCERFGESPAAIARLAPAWDGRSLAGRTLLVYGEQGIGDEVMFASCLPDLIQQAARCLVACEPRLQPVFARSFPRAAVHSIADARSAERMSLWGAVDFQVAAGSVPQFLRRDWGSFPRAERFLLADPAERDRWRQRLDDLGAGLKVGVSWRGGREPTEVRRRSASLEQWQPVLTTQRAQFVNVQYGDCAAELDTVRQRLDLRIHHFQEIDPLADLDRFAGLLAALDLVITIDNSTAHLAAALGVPTWMLVSYPSASHWRWFLDRRDSVWYSNLHLLRKVHEQSWSTLLEEAARRLADRCSREPGGRPRP